LFRGVSIDVGGPHYTRQAEDFVEAIRGQNKIHSTVESAYKVQKVIDAIYQSADSQGTPKPVSRS
jgi:predicted dehydrogenase